MKTNQTLQRDVEEAIQWEPLLKAAEIGVTAHDGIITLSGTVDSYAKKLEAEMAAKGTDGVRAVVEKISVQFGTHGRKEDNEIATDVLEALKVSLDVPGEGIKVKVEDAWVTLEGELSWNYQKEAAKKSVRNLVGVKGLTNDIIVKSRSNDALEKTTIEKAIARNWSLSEREIGVSVSGNKACLTGSVDSIYQREEAERITWNAPGVWEVDNQLKVNQSRVF